MNRLKILVSVVRFRPWPPQSIQRLILFSSSLIRARHGQEIPCSSLYIAFPRAKRSLEPSACNHRRYGPYAMRMGRIWAGFGQGPNPARRRGCKCPHLFRRADEPPHGRKQPDKNCRYLREPLKAGSNGIAANATTEIIAPATKVADDPSQSHSSPASRLVHQGSTVPIDDSRDDPRGFTPPAPPLEAYARWYRAPLACRVR